QAAAQVDTKLFEICHLIGEPPRRWLTAAETPAMVLAYDPWLHTPHEVERLRGAAAKARAALRAAPDNPLDAVWSERPAAPLASPRAGPGALPSLPRVAPARPAERLPWARSRSPQ